MKHFPLNFKLGQNNSNVQIPSSLNTFRTNSVSGGICVVTPCTGVSEVLAASIIRAIRPIATTQKTATF
jgi:hypothetical protein